MGEAIFPDLLNEQVSKYEEFMNKAEPYVPERILERPQRRLKAMEELREEIVTASQEVNEKIDAIYSKLKANVYCQDTDQGLLEIEYEEYEDCFFVDIPQITQYLDLEVKRL